VAENKQEIQISFPDDLKGGVYANNMLVAHSKEEFIVDFLMVAPPTGAVTSRVILSPGHMKRVLAALEESVAKYENMHGTIEEAEAPQANIH